MAYKMNPHYGSKTGKKMQEIEAKKYPITNKSTIHKHSGEVSWKSSKKK